MLGLWRFYVRNNETQVHSLYLHEECAIRLILEAKENLLDIGMHGQLLIDFVEDFAWKEIEFRLNASGIV